MNKKVWDIQKGNIVKYNNNRCMVLDIEDELISIYKLLGVENNDIYFTTKANLSPISESNRYFVKPISEMTEKQREFLAIAERINNAVFNGTDMGDLRVFLHVFGKKVDNEKSENM